jgi:hypothetical protein
MHPPLLPATTESSLKLPNKNCKLKLDFIKKYEPRSSKKRKRKENSGNNEKAYQIAQKYIR